MLLNPYSGKKLPKHTIQYCETKCEWRLVFNFHMLAHLLCIFCQLSCSIKQQHFKTLLTYCCSIYIVAKKQASDQKVPNTYY